MNSPAGYRVLVVDDTNLMRKMLASYLGELGFPPAVEAGDGEAAWNLLVAAKEKGTPFGLVVCDWNMPKMNGLDLLKKIRSTADFKNIPFVMVTAEGAREQVMEAVTAGVSNYVTKPFTASTLREKLKVVFPLVELNPTTKK